MDKIPLYLFIVLWSLTANSQISIKGNIVDNKTKFPVEGATVTLIPSKIFTVTDANGRFYFKGKYDASSFIIINNIGYATQKFTADELLKKQTIFISQEQIQLENIVIVSNAGDIYNVDTYSQL
jgi:hypothetical protein